MVNAAQRLRFDLGSSSTAKLQPSTRHQGADEGDEDDRDDVARRHDDDDEEDDDEKPFEFDEGDDSEAEHVDSD